MANIDIKLNYTNNRELIEELESLGHYPNYIENGIVYYNLSSILIEDFNIKSDM